MRNKVKIAELLVISDHRALVCYIGLQVLLTVYTHNIYTACTNRLRLSAAVALINFEIKFVAHF